MKVQVTCISRVRSEAWNYYADEDLIDGFVVFEGVTRIFFEPPGMVPNDLINEIRVDELADQDQARYQFVLSIESEIRRIAVLVSMVQGITMILISE